MKVMAWSSTVVICPSYITGRVEEVVHGISVIVAAARFVSGIAEESA